MTTITRFTKEQLIAHIKKQMKMREMHIASPATEQAFRKYLELEIATNEIALASLEADSDSNSHPAPVPLSNDRLHRISDILRKAAAQRDGGNIGYAMSDAVKAIDELLASRGSKPVYQYQSGIYNEDNGETDWYWDDCDIGFYEQYAADRRRILYTAPPTPVVPPAIEPDYEVIKGILPTANPDEYACCIAADMWNACRAAMLNKDKNNG